MLTTVEATIDVDGTVELLEPVSIARKTRVRISIPENDEVEVRQGNGHAMLNWLRERPPLNRTREQTEEHVRFVQQMREEWD